MHTHVVFWLLSNASTTTLKKPAEMLDSKAGNKEL